MNRITPSFLIFLLAAACESTPADLDGSQADLSAAPPATCPNGICACPSTGNTRSVRGYEWGSGSETLPNVDPVNTGQGWGIPPGLCQRIADNNCAIMARRWGDTLPMLLMCEGCLDSSGPTCDADYDPGRSNDSATFSNCKMKTYRGKKCLGHADCAGIGTGTCVGGGTFFDPYGTCAGDNKVYGEVSADFKCFADFDATLDCILRSEQCASDPDFAVDRGG